MKFIFVTKNGNKKGQNQIKWEPERIKTGKFQAKKTPCTLTPTRDIPGELYEIIMLGTPLARHREPWETIGKSKEALDAAQWERMQTGRLSEHF